MALTAEDVRKVAALARLSIAPADEAAVVHDFNRVLDYVGALAALDTAGVEPMSHAVPLTCPGRPDEPHTSLTPEAALANAPDKAENMVRVPKVVGA